MAVSCSTGLPRSNHLWRRRGEQAWDGGIRISLAYKPSGVRVHLTCRQQHGLGRLRAKQHTRCSWLVPEGLRRRLIGSRPPVRGSSV